jgi:hypothetical protein
VQIDLAEYEAEPEIKVLANPKDELRKKIVTLADTIREWNNETNRVRKTVKEQFGEIRDLGLNKCKMEKTALRRLVEEIFLIHGVSASYLRKLLPAELKDPSKTRISYQQKQEIEKERQTIELYKQGMTYAQIAKEAHVSLRDIAPILNKTGEYQSLSNSSQAYKMFEEGSNPIQVAIALNLRENQVREYYREYWDLNGMYQLNQVYEEIGNAIWSVIELHRRAKVEGLTSQQVSRILKTTTTLERQNIDLEGEQARLEADNKEAAKTFQRLKLVLCLF